MKTKFIILTLFGIIILGTIAMIGLKKVTAEQIKTASIASFSSINEVNRERSTIYYFHGRARCYACNKIEEMTKNVYEQYFKNNLDFASINIDSPENKHFIEEYQIMSKALVLVKNENGKEKEYKNLQEMWQYARNESAFNMWLINSINNFLLNNN